MAVNKTLTLSTGKKVKMHINTKNKKVFIDDECLFTEFEWNQIKLLLPYGYVIG